MGKPNLKAIARTMKPGDSITLDTHPTNEPELQAALVEADALLRRRGMRLETEAEGPRAGLKWWAVTVD